MDSLCSCSAPLAAHNPFYAFPQDMSRSFPPQAPSLNPQASVLPPGYTKYVAHTCLRQFILLTRPKFHLRISLFLSRFPSPAIPLRSSYISCRCTPTPTTCSAFIPFPARTVSFSFTVPSTLCLKYVSCRCWTLELSGNIPPRCYTQPIAILRTRTLPGAAVPDSHFRFAATISAADLCCTSRFALSGCGAAGGPRDVPLPEQWARSLIYSDISVPMVVSPSPCSR